MSGSSTQLNIDGDDVLRLYDRIERRLTPEALDPFVERIAFMTLRDVVEDTPKKWFGQVRRSWAVRKIGAGFWTIENDNKIMLFLEEGTQAHGPVRAKALFIPLTRKAAVAHKEGGTRSKGSTTVTRSIPSRGGGHRRSTSTLVYGKDYVLAKRVKGITARHIARKAEKKAGDVTLAEAEKVIEQIIRERN